MKPRHKFKLEDSLQPHLHHPVAASGVSTATYQHRTTPHHSQPSSKPPFIRLLHPWLHLLTSRASTHLHHFSTLVLPSTPGFHPLFALHCQCPGPRGKTSLILILSCSSKAYCNSQCPLSDFSFFFVKVSSDWNRYHLAFPLVCKTILKLIFKQKHNFQFLCKRKAVPHSDVVIIMYLSVTS